MNFFYFLITKGKPDFKAFEISTSNKIEQLLQFPDSATVHQLLLR